jgi:hypothetical protein
MGYALWLWRHVNVSQPLDLVFLVYIFARKLLKMNSYLDSLIHVLAPWIFRHAAFEKCDQVCFEFNLKRWTRTKSKLSQQIYYIVDFTNSMHQNPSWEADSCSVSWEISRLQWNPKTHYRVFKRPQLVPVLSQFNPIHTLKSYFFKIRSVLSYHLRLVFWSIYSLQSFQIFCLISCSSHACYINPPI